MQHLSICKFLNRKNVRGHGLCAQLATTPASAWTDSEVRRKSSVSTDVQRQYFEPRTSWLGRGLRADSRLHTSLGCVEKMSAVKPKFTFTVLWDPEFSQRWPRRGLFCVIRAARAGSDTREKIPPPQPSNGKPAKSLYTKSEILTLSCRATWVWCEGVNLYDRQMMILTRKNVCNIIGPRTPFGPLGPDNMYRFSPISRRHTVRSAVVKFAKSVLMCRVKTSGSPLSGHTNGPGSTLHWNLYQCARRHALENSTTESLDLVSVLQFCMFHVFRVKLR